MANKNGRAHRIAIISGKGGVGKSVIAANLAAALSLFGRRILVVDADLGLASLDILLGIDPQHSILDVLQHGTPVEEVLVSTAKGFDLLPAGCSRPEGTVFTEDMARQVGKLLASIDERYDIILFDAGAGIGDVVLFFAGLAHEVLLVTTPEPTSVMDAYATIKILHTMQGRGEFLLVVNQTHPERANQIGAAIAGQLRTVTSQYLSPQNPIQIELAGSIPADPMVSRAVRERKLVIETNPDAPSSYLLNHLASLLDTRLSM